MNTEFHQLENNVKQLVELAQSLRTENTAMRRAAVDLATENKILRDKLTEVQRRIDAVIEKLPLDETLPST